VLLASFAAEADDQLPDPSAIQLHGFVTQGYLRSDANNYLGESQRGTFELFEAGLTVTKELTDRLRVGMQLFGDRHGDSGDYKAKVDWAYFDYHFRDWIGVRVGRIKLPFGLYNDTADIDAAHPTALLPQSVYPQANRDYLLAQTGVELYGYRQVRTLGALEYRLYGGTIYLDLPPQAAGSSFSLLRFEIPYVTGGRVMWETPIDGLRVGASVEYLRLETRFLDVRDPTMPVPIDANAPVRLAVASAEYAADDVLFAAELSRWKSTVESSDPMVIPETSTNSIRAYGLMAYRIAPWLQPALSYSIYYPETGPTVGPSAKQHDAAVTLRFDLDPYWILKLEGHAMRGTASLSTSLNPGAASLDDLTDQWWLFVAKTTVYF
jgi:Phosphate-selective porin O and P